MLRLPRLRSAVRSVFNRARPVILMYHRVARLENDPWRLAVTPDHFAEQVEVLSRVRRIVPLRALSAAVLGGSIEEKLAAVTFDDGYADFLSAAVPVLERFEVPATLFVTTGAIDRPESFWWDSLTRILLGPVTLPVALSIVISGREHTWQLQCSGSPSARHCVRPRDLHDDMHAVLRTLSPDERRLVVNQLADWAGVRLLDQDKILRACDLESLASNRLIEIGAHTVTHPSLTHLESGSKRTEILGSKLACEAYIGRQIESFSYPFGEYDEECIALVAEAGLKSACTVESRTVRRRDNTLLLPRVMVGDCDGDRFSEQLSRRIP